jgi:hypothetical protein
VDGSLFVGDTVFDEVVKVEGHAVDLVVHIPVPPFRIFLLKIKGWLSSVVDRVHVASEGLNDIKRVSDTGQNFITLEAEHMGHNSRVVSLYNPNTVVDDVLSLESLDLKSGRSVQMNGRTSSHTCDAFQNTTKI